MADSSTRSGPLAGVRVIEMVGVGPCPFAAMWLADMGAEVIRIDRPGQRWNQTRGDILNRGRRSLAVDLKQPGAAELVLRLVAGADMLIEGFRPGVMERLGLGPEICLARNPRLVFGRVTGWGQDGPLAQRAGHDINYLAVTGVLAAIGPADGRPTPPLNLLGDFGGGGMMLVAGVLAALIEAGRSGRGQVVDAAMAEGASLLAAMIWAYHGKGLWRAERESNLFDGGAPFYGTYRCADGRYVAVGAIEPEFWSTLLDRLGIDDAVLRDHQRDRARWPELRARLAAILATKPCDDWCRLAEGSDACIAPVLGFDEAADHVQAASRGGFAHVDGTTQPAPAPRFSRTPGAIAGAPRLVGEDSRAILRDAGFASEEIDRLEARGIVAQGRPDDPPTKAGPIG
ncbi:MAG: CoA transferase [Alphaproteobacteria bacterium]|nr:CoA transferase [Alphaproteobacteria bacterium]